MNTKVKEKLDGLSLLLALKASNIFLEAELEKKRFSLPMVFVLGLMIYTNSHRFRPLKIY